MIKLKSERELTYMRDAGHIVAESLRLVEEAIAPGISTGELNQIVENYMEKVGARPTFKGYHGYPAAICASVNEELVHGIPSKDRVLQEGDICSVDIGAEIKHYNGDAAKTFAVGDISEEAARLLEVTEKSLMAGIEKGVAGARLSDISHAVQMTAEDAGYSVVRDYVGHGIGRQMHEDPQVPNYGRPGRGIKLKSGLTIAIEPMVNIGDYRVKELDDGWTVVTLDGSLCAHFEHTICIKDDKAEILTK